MSLRIYTTIDAMSQLQPRYACRRERRPGLRERHSTQLERFSPEPYKKPNVVSILSSQVPRSGSYCHSTGVAYNQPTSKPEVVEPEVRVSAYKELTTIDEIRADMRATAKRQPADAKSSVPDWLLNLDINLDVTSVDIIPPFESDTVDKSDTFNEQANVTLVYDDDDDYGYDSDVDIEMDDSESDRVHEPLTTELHELQTKRHMKETYTKDMISPVSRRRSPSRLSQPRSARSERRTPTGTFVSDNPRRYQGDKKVMSMQQGGIRSTPMQPKSKKFINQMITYRHMKIHDKKLQKAKAAVDTKMPSTFQMALDRKRLVETRLSGSFDSTRTSIQSRSSHNDTSRSKSQNSKR